MYVRQLQRRRRVKRATPDWLSKEDLEAICLKYYLAKEMELETGEKHHVDHVVPIKGRDVCGLHVPWNLEVLPARKNLSKHTSYENAIMRERYWNAEQN